MRAGLLTVAATAIVAAGVVAGAGGSSAQVSAPQWQSVPYIGSYGIQFAVLSAGRLWIGNWGAGGGSPSRLVSARVAGGRLTGWVTTPVGLGGFINTFNAVVGDYLVYSDTGSGGPPDVKAVRLLPNGKVSALTDLGGAPAPQSSTATHVAQLPDRVVRRATINGRQHEAACCDVNGKLVDWNSFLPYGAFANFGVDRHGRLWLAWYAPRKPAATIVELDPTTLQPRGKPAVAPGPTYKIDEMVCADRCRLVIEGNYGNRGPRANHFWSWAPGERSVTQITPPRDYSPSQVPQLLGAHDYRGHLVVAFSSQDKNGGIVIGLVRGDARGRNARLVRSVVAPYSVGSRNDPAFYTANWGPGSSWGTGAAFGPSVFAAVAEYQGGKEVVRVAILPL